MPRRAIVASVLVTLAATIPASASASTVASNGNTITYTADPGEVNAVVIAPHGSLPGWFQIFDPSVTITPSGACSGGQAPGVDALCQPGPNLIIVDLGDQNDSIDLTAMTTFNGVNGGDGADTLEGGEGNDLLFGYGASDDGAADTLRGNGHADAIYGGDGADVISGGANGPDGEPDYVRYLEHTAGVTVNLSDGQDNDGNAADGPVNARDQLTGIESVEGTAFNDTLTGDADMNDLTGLAGADVIDGEGGLDDSTGYFNHVNGVTVDLGGGTGDDGNAEDGPLGARDTLTDIEAVGGTDQADTLTGGESRNALVGVGGADTINGAGGDDGLNGGGGDDDFTGGAGDDDFYGDAGSDRVLYGGAPGAVNVNLVSGVATGDATTQDDIFGVEDVTGSPFADTIIANDAPNDIDGAGGEDVFDAVDGDGVGGGNDTFTGGAGFSDILTYEDATAGVNVDVPNTQVTGDGTTDTFAGVEIHYGSATQADTFTGGAGIDIFEGLGGADTMTGGGQNDDLRGGSGNDALSGNGGIDLIQGGVGPGDTADYSTAGAGVTANLTTQTASNDGDTLNDNLSGIENLTGSGQSDDLTGAPGFANTINSLGGPDTVRVRDSGADTVDCGAQTDLAITDGATETSVTNCETNDDPSPPGTPSITASTPGSGADDNNPEIVGTAPMGSTVSLYTSASCTGAPVATGGAASFASPGLTVSVADNSTITLHAQATLPLESDGPSVCSAPFSFTEVTPAAGGGDGGGATPDTTPPDTTLVDPLSRTNDQTPTFNFRSSEAGSRFECRVDKRDPRNCDSPKTTGNLDHGNHTFRVRAIDAAGNRDETAARAKFKVTKE